MQVWSILQNSLVGAVSRSKTRRSDAPKKHIDSFDKARDVLGGVLTTASDEPNVIHAAVCDDDEKFPAVRQEERAHKVERDIGKGAC